MKKIQIILLAIATLFSFSSAKAQSTAGNKILTAYYSLKDAFVAGDPATVKANAQNLQQALAGNAQASTDKAAWDKFVISMQNDAKQIAGSNTIAGQRGYFNHLSESMYNAVKTFKLNAAPVYHAYCPMKKAYWLSNTAEIANPHYGNQMLTCGQVKETINVAAK